MRRLDEAVKAVRVLAPQAALAREHQRLWRADITSSTALAGSTLDPREVDALLDRGLALGDRPFAHYVLVRNYADANRWVAEQRARGSSDRRPLLVLDEVRQLHARVVAGAAGRGGAWRLGNPPPRDAVVAPGAWLVPREMEALVDRLARGPGDAPIALWLARAFGRIARIHPFEDGNGRVARLTANLLLRRLDAPPMVLELPERRRFGTAVAAAEANEPAALAKLIADAVVRSCDRLIAVAHAAHDPLAPLRDLAGDAYAALAKAAQRGTLRTVLRGGRYFTTPGWISEYRRR